MAATLRLQTQVEIGRSRTGLSFGDRITVLGSCFADNAGRRMADYGFNVCVNPFGTLYNPVSICNSVARLSSGVPFTEADCVEMGAGAGLICSFSHHSSFARSSMEDFLDNANAALAAASGFWKVCNKVLITLGTCWCYRCNATGETVSNCLKRPAAEFTRYALGPGETSAMLGRLIARHPDKQFFITVSPVRHLADGAHGNQLSKGTLLLSADALEREGRCEYFPAYEIMMDELRDYRFYAEDMVHPSAQAEEYIFGRFIDFALPDKERPVLEANIRSFKRSRHRPLHRP